MAKELSGVIGRRIAIEEEAHDKLGNSPADQLALACGEQVFRGDSATANAAPGIDNHGDMRAAVKQGGGGRVEAGRIFLLRCGCIFCDHDFHPLFG